MKVFKIIFFSVFCFVNIFVLIINLMPKKSVLESNNYVSIANIDNYYYDGKYDSESKYFKLKSKDGVSSVDVYFIDNLISNNYLYTEKEIYRSINYQILNDLKGYREVDFSYDEGYGYSKNLYGDMIIETFAEFVNDKILVICYSSSSKFYDVDFLDYVKEKVNIVAGV